MSGTPEGEEYKNMHRIRVRSMHCADMSLFVKDIVEYTVFPCPDPVERFCTAQPFGHRRFRKSLEHLLGHVALHHVRKNRGRRGAPHFRRYGSEDGTGSSTPDRIQGEPSRPLEVVLEPDDVVLAGVLPDLDLDQLQRQEARV
jgi:hypothetical protein